MLWVLEENPSGLTSRELSERLGVSERTARRDLQTLRATGYPLTLVGSRWLFVEGQGLPTSLASDGAEEENARNRILTLDRAIRGRRQTELLYWSPGRRDGVTLQLAPLALRFVDGSLFLVARELPQGRWRAFAIERMARIEPQKKRFPKALGEGLEAYLEGPFSSDGSAELIRVLVHFDASVAWRLTDRVWHPSQRVRRQEDGSVAVALRVPGLAWVTAWVLGFGSRALVISPPALVRSICKELELTRDKYCDAKEKLAQLYLFEDGT